MNQKHLHDYANLFGLWVISLTLILIFQEQLSLDELPCPLCLLQRAAMIGVGLSMMANLLLGIKAEHYGLLLLYTIIGAVASIRQVLLHIVPGQSGYGSPLWGLHLYTWSALFFVLIIICTSVGLLFSKGISRSPARLSRTIVKFSAMIFLSLILLNAISAFLECGFWQCADDPVRYELLTRLGSF